MEELFTMLSSSARLDKRRNNKKKQRRDPDPSREHQQSPSNGQEDGHVVDSDVENDPIAFSDVSSSRDRTGKRDTSTKKLEQIHSEQMAAFRRSMNIKISNKHDPELADAIASFDEIHVPSWWDRHDDKEDQISFAIMKRAIQSNIEAGRWKEPTPIQMQSIPTLLERRDLLACAPTGSGKSGAFILPAIVLSHASHGIYYGANTPFNGERKKKGNEKSSKSGKGEIRSLVLAPSRELAAQLHREVERLGTGKPGGISSMLLMKSNAAHVIAGTAGGKSGLDVLVTTPLRLVDALSKGLRLDAVRLVVLDEADRLLDAADGKRNAASKKEKVNSSDDDSDSDEDGGSGDEADDTKVFSSGSSQTQTFLTQMDIILSSVPASAVRALFSATVTQTVKSLSESILRNPVDVTVSSPGSSGGANTDIEQELMFVGREEGKLLAMRQLKQRGQLKPPAIVFVQSQERAQALFGELLYDGLHVDVIHAGRSRTARDSAVAKFRKGETWVLICTDLVARGVDFRAVNMVINYDLPTSGVTYVHRIGRCGRAGRKGKAITLFTETDFENLRTIANVMKQSGCVVEDWMLQLKRTSHSKVAPRRYDIDTTPRYDKKKRFERRQTIRERKQRKKQRTEDVNKSSSDRKAKK